jgi:membrane protease YdiL (CAAX protease family)
MSMWCARITRPGESRYAAPTLSWQSWTVTTEPVLVPPPGWYTDPYDPRAQRWWDGTTWTQHVVFPAGSASTILPAGTAPAAGGVVAPPQGRWGLPDIGWTALVVVAMLILGVVLVLAVVAFSPGAMDGQDLAYDLPVVAWLMVVSQGLVMAGLAAWPMIAGRWKGDGWRKSFGFVVNGRAWLIGGVGGIATFIVLLTLTVLSSIVLGEEVDSAAADVVSGMENVTLAYIIFLLFIAIGAPFVEEISFRGLMWGAIVKKGWSPWIATAVSAVAFGLFHFEPLRVVALIAAGFVLGIVRHYAGLAASMLSHAIVNTIGVVFMLLAP